MLIGRRHPKRELEGVGNGGNSIYGPIRVTLEPSGNLVLGRSNGLCERNERKAAFLSVGNDSPKHAQKS